jgi:hypothetical protein
VTRNQDALLGRLRYAAVTADEGVSLFPALSLLKDPIILEATPSTNLVVTSWLL